MTAGADDQFLAGKSALVTGGSRNLGATIAERLAAHGASVAITFHTGTDTATALVERLERETGRPHHAFGGDLASSDAVREVVGSAQEALGSIDILVNNAGPFSMTPFTELPEAEWDRVWNSNVKAAYLAAQLVAPPMRASGFGRIVNVSAVCTPSATTRSTALRRAPSCSSPRSSPWSSARR